MNSLLSRSPYSCSFSVGPRARLATDCAKLFTASCLLNVHMATAHVQGQRCPWARSSFQIPSRMTFHFLSCWSHPLEGIWSLECLWCFLLSMPKPPRRWLTSEACANGVLSQSACQAVVFLCCLFDVYLAWCLVCPHPVPSMWQVFITIGLVWKLWKIFVELPLTHHKSISFPHSTPFPSPLYHTDTLLDMRKFPYTEVKKKTNQEEIRTCF